MITPETRKIIRRLVHRIAVLEAVTIDLRVELDQLKEALWRGRGD